MTWQPLSRNEWITVLRSAVAMGRTLPEPPTECPVRSDWPTRSRFGDFR